eukprot:m.25732 g.25732  ORF g.25732 m.25732 type:complete len:776 (+) comp28932_c0_seq2:138-2465(+)
MVIYSCGFLLLVFLIKEIEGALPQFVDDPSQNFTDGGVLIPPDGRGALTVFCSTKEKANITWLSEKVPADVTALNITQITDRKSVLHQENAAGIPTVRGVLLGPPFSCKATNSDGESATTGPFSFLLGKVPTLSDSSSLSDETKIEGESVQFECAQATGVLPLASFTWKYLKDGSTVLEATGEKSTYSLTANRHNAGEYLCNASNVFGWASEKANLTVLYAPNVSVSGGENVRDGSPLVLTINVDAWPAANITLTKDNVTKKSATKNAVLSYTETATNASTGEYKVTAVNSVGNMTKTFQIYVKVHPDPPVINMTSPTDRTVTYTWALGFNGYSQINNLSLQCTDRKTNSYEVTKTVALSANLNSDTLSELYPGTTYFCKLFASNEIGTSGPSPTVNFTTIASVPAQPVCHFVSSNETSITFNFTVGFTGGQDITLYSLNYTMGSEVFKSFPVTMGTSVTQKGGQVTVTNLVKKNEYNFRLSARNSKGASLPCTPKYATDCKPFAPIPILNGSTYSEGGQVKLTFTVPSDNGCGSVTAYRVADTVSGLTLPSTFNVTGGQVILTITSLPARNSTIAVTTLSEGGAESLPSSAISIFIRVTSAPTSTPTAPFEKDGGLSSGVIAGIVVASVVVIVAVLLIVICACMEQRQSKEEKKSTLQNNSELGMAGQYKRTSIGYDETDTKDHPGPNSGSTYRGSDSEEPEEKKSLKETPKAKNPMYADLDHSETPLGKICMQEERVTYASINRSASRHSRESSGRNKTVTFEDQQPKLSTFV